MTTSTYRYNSPEEFFNDISNFSLGSVGNYQATIPDQNTLLELIQSGSLEDGIINFGGVTQYYSSLAEFILTFDVSYTMDGASQISMEFFDPEYKMTESNFFQIRQPFQYRGMNFEIATLEVGPGPGGSPSVKVEARNAAIQKMKRNKNTRQISGSSGYDYARNAAAKYGLRFLGERSANQKNIVHPKASDKDSSVWSVLQSVANTNEFMLFEVDGTLVYASQKYLLWKLGLQSRVKTTVKKAKSDKQLTEIRQATSQKFSRLYFDPTSDSASSTLEFSDEALRIATYPDNPRPAIQGTTNLILLFQVMQKLGSQQIAYVHEEGKHKAIIPIISLLGQRMTREEAIKEYKRTGNHLGKFIASTTAESVFNAYESALRVKLNAFIALGDAVYTQTPAFELVTYPTFRRSDNDPLEGDGNVFVRKPNGQLLRPGHTALVGPKPTQLAGGYLITEVSYSELTPDPVQVTFRTPIKPEQQDKPA